MARAARRRDWSQTALGPPDEWPERLRFAAELALASGAPTLVWWGRDLAQIGNDAAAALFPAARAGALGKPAAEAWGRAWAPWRPAAEAVWRSGRAERVLFAGGRRAPAPRESGVAWLSPIPDGRNGVAGLTLLAQPADALDRFAGAELARPDPARPDLARPDLAQPEALDLALAVRGLRSELRHHVANLLSVVRSLARRTADASGSVEDFAMRFDGRLSAVARAHAKAFIDPRGVLLASLVADELASFDLHENGRRGAGRLRIEGPEVYLERRVAWLVGLAVHELAANAVTHGSASVRGAPGDIEACWRLLGAEGEPRRLAFAWVERLRRPAPAPRRRGFGLELLERGLAYDIRARARVRFENGEVRCDLEIPLDAPSAPPAPAARR